MVVLSRFCRSQGKGLLREEWKVYPGTATLCPSEAEKRDWQTGGVGHVLSDEHRALSPVGKANSRGTWTFWGCREISSQLGPPKTVVRRTLQKRVSDWVPDSQWTPKAPQYLATDCFSNLFLSLSSQGAFLDIFSNMTPSSSLPAKL